jgi:hypothetical protein
MRVCDLKKVIACFLRWRQNNTRNPLRWTRRLFRLHL